MGESTFQCSSEGDNQKNKNNNEGGVINVVLKFDLHCKGCVEKISRSVKRFEGVKKASGDVATNKLTVTGKVGDPAKLKSWVESKTNKKVDLISPQQQQQQQQPKKDNDGDAKMNKAEDQKSEKKTKEGPTVVLRTALHCQGCIEKMQKLITKTKGVQEVSIDAQKETVTVKGTMDVKALQACLQDKLKRVFDIVPPKNEKNNSGGGGEKNKKDSGGGGGVGAEAGWGVFSRADSNNNSVAPIYYGRQPGYSMEYVHAPQYFSDENPHACSVM
ncbi:hypothetical protein Scep_005144 [Stephania cephalantha]|uniref:HMA domain-containing protein n=1 Tax=Stephania cephalantha TaxID=152367 RepID=A0AAP0KUN7_9MAGN